MGLDMYLYRRQYVSGHSWNTDIDKDFTYKSLVNVLAIEPCKESPHMNIEVCVAYWRKANAIHKWFCDLDGGKDECQNIYVTRENLVELRDLCNSVLFEPALASSTLPTQRGFFFGSYDYDDWYMEDMRNTVDQLDKILESTPSDDFAFDFIYRASW
jgi:hypothetical protein